MIAWALLILMLLIYCVTLPKLLARAGMNGALGYIPIVNLFFLIKLVKRPWYWFILLFAPGVNILLLIILNVEVGIAFNQRSRGQQWKFGAIPWFAIPELAFKNTEAKYVGPRVWKKKEKGMAREWGEAILFAVIAATVIRTFVFEAYTIPTPSMEGSMLVGDYLFVSKMSYGAKSPQTPMSFPFVHNRMPGSMTKSYTNWFSMPYFRLPGLGKVDRYDPVVFNFPPGDTVIVDPVASTFDYYQIVRNQAISQAGSMDAYLANPGKYEQIVRKGFEKKFGLMERPLDKREHYIKRCVGLPGETLELREGDLYINGSLVEAPEGVQFNYRYRLSNPANQRKMEEMLELSDLDFGPNGRQTGEVALTPSEVAKLQKANIMDTLYRVPHTSQRGDLNIFPNSPKEPYIDWDIDNFGPVKIPKAGESIELDLNNIDLYKRSITHFEGHDLKIEGDQILIDGQPATSYTFELDHYWMMGDNRHNSLDARYWGFVPETHVVGKAVFTWFSKENELDHGPGRSGIRWNRMFRLVD